MPNKIGVNMQVNLLELKELLLGTSNNTTPINQGDSDYEIGKGYNFMTVLGWYKGILTKETDKTFTIENASWVSESERFSEYVKDDSKVKEEEPFEAKTKLIIERSSVIAGFQLPSITRKLK